MSRGVDGINMTFFTVQLRQTMRTCNQTGGKEKRGRQARWQSRRSWLSALFVKEQIILRLRLLKLRLNEWLQQW